MSDQLKPGDQMKEEILDGDGNVLYSAIHEITEVEAAPEGGNLTARTAPRIRTRITEETWHDAELQAANQDAGPLGADKDDKGGKGGDPVKTGLEVAKFAWQFIKDNKPVVDLQTASTSVLSKADTDPLNYHSARPGTSGIYRWRFYNWPVTEWTAWDVEVELGGTYAAQAPADAPDGNYLPSVYFNVPRCDVGWPHSVSAEATVTNPSNIGGPNSVNAMCEVLAKLNGSNVLENFTKTFKFKAVGTSGFSRA